MRRILIADASRLFCEALTECLGDDLDIRSCYTGDRVLDMVREDVPDLLVLDLGLPFMDGLTILRTLYTAGYRIPVLALTTCFASDYVLQKLVDYGVAYIFAKPCSVVAVTTVVREILSGERPGRESSDRDLHSLPMSLGFQVNFSGYPCVAEALRLYRQNTSQQITKELYPMVAKTCGGTASRVERAIRSTVRKAWECRNEAVWSLYFPEDTVPSNTRFLARIAMSLENEIKD